MDLRSIQPGLAAVSQMPLFMVHPRTGEMITPLMWSRNGTPVWPVMGGASEEGEDADGDKDDDADEEADDDENDDSDDTDDDEDEDGDDEDGKKGKKKGNAQAKIKALEEEKDRHFRKAKKAAKRAETAEAELAALKAKYESGDDDKDKDGDKGKDNKSKVDDSKIKAAEAAAEKLRVENAFLKVNEVSWIKPEQALALMMADDDYEVEFDDDGKVDRKSLRAELKRFAKANPHLVKKPAAKTDDEDDADEGGTGSKSTAPKMNGTRKGKKDKPKTREELAKKFPVLNRMS